MMRLIAPGTPPEAAHLCCGDMRCTWAHLLLGVPMPQLHLCKPPPMLPCCPGLLLVPNCLLVQLLPQGTYGLLQLRVLLLQAVHLLHLLHQVLVAPDGCRQHQHHCNVQPFCRLQLDLAAVTQRKMFAKACRLPQPTVQLMHSS